MLKQALILLALLLPVPGQADIVVIVNATNPIRNISSQEVAELYLGRSHTFSSGEFALAFDHPRDSALREQFFRKVANMSISQVNTYWSRLLFAGQETPPRSLAAEQAVLDVVRRNPGAIGYVGSPPKEALLRVVLHLKD